MKSWLAQGSSGRRVTLLSGTTFLHINGALVERMTADDDAFQNGVIERINY